MRQEHSKTLFSYWDTLRRGRAAPERTEIEPVEIRQILGDTFILEISMELRAVSFRLAGTRLCGAYGRELKGLGFLALWREEDNFEIAKALAKVYRDYQPVLLNYVGEAATSLTVDYEMLMLPLAPAPDGNARILGVATPRLAPYWLGAQPVLSNRLIAVRYPVPTTQVGVAPAIATPIGAGDETAEAAVTPGGRRVAHLTVLEGGRE